MIDSIEQSRAARRSLLAVLLLAAAWSAGQARAQAPFVDRVGFHDPKLLPPCAAEGACRPRRATTGYYATRWRPWPGEAAEATGAATEKDRSALPIIEDIDPKLEDREAPEPSEAIDESSEAGADATLPPLPPLPGLPGEPPAADPAPAFERGERPPLPPFPRRPPGAAITPDAAADALLNAEPSPAFRPLRSLLGSISSEAVKLTAERAQDTPPPLPAGLPGATRAAWVVSSDGPPALPWGRETTTDSAVRKASSTNAKPSLGPAGRSASGKRFDAAVRPTAMRLPPTQSR